MALIQQTLIWVVYAIVIVLLLSIAAIFVHTYQTPRDRSAFVSTVSIFTITALLATVLLLPVDIALVSNTTSSKLGLKKDWATPRRVEIILLTLKIIYYTLYSLDALLCLIVVPFTYFWYESYDEAESAEGTQTFGKRLWEAFRYTTGFILLVIILFLIGFFLPIAGKAGDKYQQHLDLDYFRKLLTENHGERALTFALGLLITIGILFYVLYTAAGLALLPISFIKSAPSISAPDLSATSASALEANRDRQRQLEGRNAGRADGLSTKDHRELEGLIRDERTLVRRQRLAAEASGEGKSWIIRAWTRVEAIFRPIKLLGGIVLLLLSLTIWVSMLLTGIDKAKNSICKRHCGYVLGQINLFNPINWLFVESAKVFPVDYVVVTLLVLFFFSSSVVGIASIGIRFLWIRIFSIRKGHTSPQALLMATVMLTFMVLAINYSVAIMVAPEYAMFGPQKYCDHAGSPGDCAEHPELIKPCSELLRSDIAIEICTPSVMSTFLNRVTVNFPFFGVVDFWAQFGFLAVFLVVFVTALVRTPKLDVDQLDADAEAEEEEGLLASTSRRFGATWGDITGRPSSSRQRSLGGAAGRGGRGDHLEDD